MCEKMEFWNDLRSGKFASMVRESSAGQKLNNPEETYNIMKPLFADQSDVESFYVIFLNAKNKILEIEKLFSGSITSSSVYPREIVKRVLALKSAAVILVHNHPSGDTEPSNSDYVITTRIGVVLESISVMIHDHMIVGDGYHSMSEAGKLKIIQDKISELTV
jgi:DNA repair protein RadC